MTVALVLVVIGLIFFARSLGYVDDDTISILWPLLLVIVGLSMVSHRWFGHRCDDKDCWRCSEINFGDKPKKRR